jgi:molybdopterin-guanine dinucleotide biosynthesis protein
MEDLRRCPTANLFDSVEERPACIVIVAGLASGTGKTSAAEALILLLRAQGTVAAVKVTVTHGDRGCPHGGRSCNVCGGLGEDFEVITSPSVIKQPNTDTGRFHKRGADPVLWLVTRRASAPEGWVQLKSRLRNIDAVVVESNTLAEIVNADLLIMVADPTANRRLWKDSATALLERADLVVVNERGSDEQISRFYSEMERSRGASAPVVRVKHPLHLEQEELLRELLFSRGVIKSRHADLSSVT